MYDPAMTEGLGVPESLLRPGLVVVVPIGRIPAAVNGTECVIGLATVLGRVEGEAGTWWLEVYAGAGTAMEQMYRHGEILGVPALGMTISGPPHALSPGPPSS